MSQVADNVAQILEQHASNSFGFEVTATHCNTLQNTATHCNTLQHASNSFESEAVAAEEREGVGGVALEIMAEGIVK